MAARLVRAGKYSHITPILRSLHWLPIHHRITYKIASLTYKALHGLSPSYLSELVRPYKPSRSLRSANELKLQVPKTKHTTLGDRAFSCAAANTWNSLPLSIRQSSSYKSFQRKLKTHLFEIYFNNL